MGFLDQILDFSGFMRVQGIGHKSLVERDGNTTNHWTELNQVIISGMAQRLPEGLSQWRADQRSICFHVQQDVSKWKC
jgi:hypothetical protein